MFQSLLVRAAAYSLLGGAAVCAFAQEPAPARQPAPAHRPTLRTHVAPVVRPQQNDARPGGGSAAPIERRPPAMNAGGEAQVSANPHPGTATGKGFNNPGASSLYNGKGEHLSAWMKAHGNMTLQQQQAALEHEPGFRELPPETQQRYRDRLSELNALPPAERQRRLAYTEQMERLTPQQRTEVRSTMLQLSALPPEQKKTVMHAFHELRGLPPEQRLNLLNTRYRNFSEPQRNTLEQLMRVEPMLPADHFAENQPPPGQPR